MNKSFGELSEIDVVQHCDGCTLVATDLRGEQVSSFINQEEDMGTQIFEFLSSINITTSLVEGY